MKSQVILKYIQKYIDNKEILMWTIQFINKMFQLKCFYILCLYIKQLKKKKSYDVIFTESFLTIYDMNHKSLNSIIFFYS